MLQSDRRRLLGVQKMDNKRMRPGQIFEVDDKEDINFMAYDPQGSFMNSFLGSSGGLGAASASHQSNCQAYGQQMMNAYSSQTAEQYAERQKQREEEEARVAEEQKRKDELRALNRPKMMQCFGGSIICLAFAVLFFSMNMSFHNTDYNTSLVSSVMWFLDVVSVGSAIGLGLLGRYYSK